MSTSFQQFGEFRSGLCVNPSWRTLYRRVRKRSSTRARHRIRRRPKRKTVQKLKIAWRLCYSRKPFRELCPRMRTPERGQLEACTIGFHKPPRRFSGPLRHTVTCPRLDLLYQTTRHCARGESKKSLEAPQNSGSCIFPSAEVAGLSGSSLAGAGFRILSTSVEVGSHANVSTRAASLGS